MVVKNYYSRSEKLTKNDLMDYPPTELSLAYDWLDRYEAERTRLGLVYRLGTDDGWVEPSTSSKVMTAAAVVRSNQVASPTQGEDWGTSSVAGVPDHESE